MHGISVQDWFLLFIIMLILTATTASMDWMGPSLQPVYAESLYVETMGAIG